MQNYKIDRKLRRQKHKVDKDLKRARERFSSLKTQLMLSQALSDAPGITVFDKQRIADQLRKCWGDLKHFGPGGKELKLFRAAVATWATTQAHFTVRLREMLPGLKVNPHVTTLLFTRLPEFDGTDADFPAWITATVKHEGDGLQALAHWITRHRAAVYAGIWRVLRSCRDLDNCLDDVADILASEIWWYVANNPVQFLDSPVPIREQLRSRAYWRARAWKTARLAAIKSGEILKPSALKPEQAESKQAYYANSGKLPPRPIILGPGNESSDEPIREEFSDLENFDRSLDYEESWDDSEEHDAKWNDAEIPIAA